MAISSNGVLETLSGEIEQLAEKVGRSVVSVGSAGRAGSGIVWDDKTVVTAYHLVKGLDQVTVGTEDGRKLAATVLGRLLRSDIAVLKVETGLPPAERSDSQKVKVGQFVLALANPFASRTSVTSGIVTSADRTVGGWWGVTVENAIVTDARVNPGYSGGPLVDASGRLIGLNVAYVSSRGIAVPVASISRAVTRLSSGKPFRKAYLGIVSNSVPLPPEASSDENVGQDSGLIILSVDENTPAKESGLTLGDVLLKFDGKPVSDQNELVGLLSEDAIGRAAKLLIMRGGKVMELTITPRGEED